jgi:TetR/AcrR family transcriptional regulator
VQICAVMDQDAMGAPDFERATEHAVSFILRGCGL